MIPIVLNGGSYFSIRRTGTPFSLRSSFLFMCLCFDLFHTACDSHTSILVSRFSTFLVQTKKVATYESQTVSHRLWYGERDTWTFASFECLDGVQ